MNLINVVMLVIKSIFLLLPLLLGVAYLTVLERKVIGYIQRRVSVNIVGMIGILQPFADALKLLSKENLIPSHSNLITFMIGPVLVLIFSLIGWLVIPLTWDNIGLLDININSAYSLAISSLGVYGIMLAGWGANSKYALIGSMRSTAQLISYELLFTTSVLIVIISSNSFNYSSIIKLQESIWNIVPYFPIFIIYLISSLAETNRAPFDNVEAESELVAGFFSEHSSVPFVMFFLGEYNALLLISFITCILFIGIDMVALKTALLTALFVWVRATLPRFRFDTLMTFCWTKLLPIIVALLLIQVSSIHLLLS